MSDNTCKLSAFDDVKCGPGSEKADSRFVIIGPLTDVDKTKIAERLNVPASDLIVLQNADEIKQYIKDEKPRGLAIANEPFVISRLPEPKNLIPFKEQSNYIAGKKPPRKNKRR